MQLILNDEILKVQHAHAVAEWLYAEAGYQIRGGFWYGNDAPAVLLLELLEDAADKRGLARGGAAGENYARDAFGHGKSPSKDNIYDNILPLRGGQFNIYLPVSRLLPNTKVR